MLSERLPGLFAPLDVQQSLETAALYSIAGGHHQDYMIGQRPFRSPHHTASGVALVGGGTQPRPGEISLAHNGVLFLDELAIFSSCVRSIA